MRLYAPQNQYMESPLHRVKKAIVYLTPIKSTRCLSKSPCHNSLLDNVFRAVGGSWLKCWVWANGRKNKLSDEAYFPHRTAFVQSAELWDASSPRVVLHGVRSDGSILCKVEHTARSKKFILRKREHTADVCEPLAVHVSRFAHNVSRRSRIFSQNLSPRQRIFVSRADYVCEPQQVGVGGVP